MNTSTKPGYHFFKRLFDILVSVIGLILLSSVFFLFAILIKRESPGPVFFRGPRVGRRGRLFNILKFRTMFEPPAGGNGSPLTLREDERVTPLGRWLRDTKINELPQLWNVLKGEMSLVGPRPEDPLFVEKWPPQAREIILSVRPGITSPASVSWRDEQQQLVGTDVINVYLEHIAPEKLRLDVRYVQHGSFLVDLDIIFMTFVLLLPLLRKVKPPERSYFSGPLLQFVHGHLSWFIIDALVAFIAISISILVWRLFSPLNLGWGVTASLAVVMAFFFTLFNYLLKVNRISWRQAGPGWILKLMVSSALVITLLTILSLSRQPIPTLPVPLIWLAGALTLTGMVAVRYRERILTGLASRWLHLRKGKAGLPGDRALIIGAGRSARLVDWMITHNELVSPIWIIGLVDDNPDKIGMRIGEFRVLGSVEEIPLLVKKHGITLILLAINNISDPDKLRITRICQQTGARLVVVPDYFHMFTEELTSKESAAA